MCSTCSASPARRARYNPLDRLSADSLDLGEDASTLAEALVMDPPSQTSDAHWNEEARALIAGLVLFRVVHEEPEREHLGTVREYLTLPPSASRSCYPSCGRAAAPTG